MEIVLVDLEPSVVQAWKKAFKRVDCVSVRQGSIFNVPCDAIVSPANSFGFMDAGLDRRIAEFFGPQVRKRLQILVHRKHHGELLVGHAEIVMTDHHEVPYLISAPAMRVPMVLGPETVNVYLAMRAVLLLIRYGNFEASLPVSELVETVAVPGIGTGIAQVPPEVCARQMRRAFDDVLGDGFEFPRNCQEASERHQRLYTDKPRDLTH